MGANVNELLKRWGPDHCEVLTPLESVAWCRTYTRGRTENFSVLSRFMPIEMRDGACAVYAYCRWADDFADESPSSEIALERLAWWRCALHDCFEGQASHPVFVALQVACEKHNLERAPFDDLLDAFGHDQHVARYDNWSQLMAYCAKSANPVGRIVLRLGGASESPMQLALSDQVCTGLQLANHWQDVRRDFLNRNRVYLPADAHEIADFDQRLASTCRVGHAPDRAFLEAYRSLLKTLVERTRPMVEAVDALVEDVQGPLRPMLWLFGAGGIAVLDSIERGLHETLLTRPRVSALCKARLLLKARRLRP
jgi:squalene synthase HpnC